MHKGWLRRVINAAFAEAEQTPFRRCDLCGGGKGVVRVPSRILDQVFMICQECAAEFLDTYGYGCAEIIASAITQKHTAD